MTVRVNKSSFNIREKLSELGRKFGLKGSELVAAETAQEARELVSAGRKNLIINGDFRVNQRGGTHTLISGYHLDRWKFQKDGLGQYAHSVTSSTDTPAGFSKSLRLEVTTTESSISSTEDLALTQEIEGQNLQLLAAGTNSAKPFTLSFWVKSTKPGTYCVSIVADPATNNKIFSTTYTINVANVWERKIIKIPPCTLTTIPNVSSRGMSVRWITLAGSAYTGATGGNLHEWDDYHSSLFAGGHQTQIDTDGDVWQLTGVQLEVGRNATDFEHRSYGEEFALCQRYYQKKRIGYGRVAHFRTDAILVFAADLPVELRASAGSISQDSGLNNWAYRDGVSPTISSIQSNNSSASETTLSVLYSVSSGGDSDETCFYYGGGSILIDAEL